MKTIDSLCFLNESALSRLTK